VPVHDIAVKEGDLVIATHGRSFYIMDDLSVLRQLTPQTLAKAAHLFVPRETYRVTFGGGGGGNAGGASPVGANPASGAIVYYWLTQPARTVTLEFRDSTGRTIRRFSNDTTPKPAATAPSTAADTAAAAGNGERMEQDALPQRGGGAADPRLPNRAGLNTFAWNMRESDATRFDGMIFWSAGTTGPLILPGTYSARLVVDGAVVQNETFVVKKDPRTDATPADLVAQYTLLMQIRDRTTDANDAVRTVRHVRAQATAKSAEVGSDSTQYAQHVQALDARIGELEAKIYQVKNQSAQDPLNYPIRVNNQIAALASVVGSTEARPTTQSKQVFDLLTKELGVYLVELRAAWKTLLPPIDAIRQKHGLPAIEVKRTGA